MSALSKVRAAVLDGFFGRWRKAPSSDAPIIFDNPTEELEDALKRGKNITIHGAKPLGRPGVRGRLLDLMKYGPKGSARDDMNYLFSTRRYPQSTTNVLPAAPHIPAGDYPYFSQPVNGDGGPMGFPSGFLLSMLETNLDNPNQVPQGKGFIIRQEGLSFNMEALSQDIEQILDSGALVYQTQGGQFSIRKGPLSFWPGGHGVVGFSTNQGQESAHHGIADPSAVRHLGRLPRIIKPLQNFNYHHIVPRAERNTTGIQWVLSQFTTGRMWLWGEQVDKIPE